jgi:cysteinyl-tRNA synthetase
MPEASPDPPETAPPGTPPAPVLAAARARADARAARDFATADRLRAEIEAAGWRVVDQGIDYRLEPAHPPDLADGARVRYGASASVPSRLAEPASARATIVLLATDWPEDLARALDGIAAHVPGACQVVVVADDPSPAQSEALVAIEGSEPAAAEIVWTSARLGTAAAIDCGLRRAIGAVVALLDTSLEPIGDFVSPLVTALEDPNVAVTGGWGIVSDDLRTFRDAAAGDVDAIEGYCQAFRRADVVLRGPLDERFRYYRNLDIWWSLVLRDEGPGAPPRRALAIDALPFIRHEHRGYASLPPAERDRLSKRNFYRILDRFGSRRDLLVSERSG